MSQQGIRVESYGPHELIQLLRRQQRRRGLGVSRLLLLRIGLLWVRLRLLLWIGLLLAVSKAAANTLINKVLGIFLNPQFVSPHTRGLR